MADSLPVNRTSLLSEQSPQHEGSLDDLALPLERQPHISISHQPLPDFVQILRSHGLPVNADENVTLSHSDVLPGKLAAPLSTWRVPPAAT
jgi:hypothetical protein